MRVFAGMCGSRDTGRAEAVFLENRLVGGKVQSPGPVLLSLSSNSEWNGRLDASLGPADVCGRRKGFVRGRQTGGGKDLVGFGMAGADGAD